jgi:hypothetical protein
VLLPREQVALPPHHDRDFDFTYDNVAAKDIKPKVKVTAFVEAIVVNWRRQRLTFAL